MNDNLKDILSNLHSEVDQEALLRYLQGKLSAEEQHLLEKNMIDDEFEADAVDGLQTIHNKQNIPLLVEQLNKDLKKKTSRKNRWLFKREAKVEPWLLLTIVIILLLLIVSFFVIYRMSR